MPIVDYALFVDVMGLKAALTGPDGDAADKGRLWQTSERLEDFHRDLTTTVEAIGTLAYEADDDSFEDLSFVAEFSDSAFLLSIDFRTVAFAGTMLMRKALRHKYALRGGIGAGSFLHQISGVRAPREGPTWTTSSFLGGAAVTAYQAERHSALGLRIFVHREAIKRRDAEDVHDWTLRLPENEAHPSVPCELRIWNDAEARIAAERLRAMRDEQQELTDRARAHYDAALNAYKRFEDTKHVIPHMLPALWL